MSPDASPYAPSLSSCRSPHLFIYYHTPRPKEQVTALLRLSSYLNSHCSTPVAVPRYRLSSPRSLSSLDWPFVSPRSQHQCCCSKGDGGGRQRRRRATRSEAAAPARAAAPTTSTTSSTASTRTTRGTRRTTSIGGSGGGGSSGTSPPTSITTTSPPSTAQSADVPVTREDIMGKVRDQLTPEQQAWWDESTSGDSWVPRQPPVTSKHRRRRLFPGRIAPSPRRGSVPCSTGRR